MKQFKKLLLIASLSISSLGYGQSYSKEDSVFIKKIFDSALTDGKSYEWLRFLTKNVGHRLSGSAGAAKAVTYTEQVMKDEKFDNVFLQNVMVPHWVRGNKEKGQIIVNGKRTNVPTLALGGSIATKKGGIQAPVIEVKSFPELRALGTEKVKGKIVFFNRPVDPTKMDTFGGYGGAVEQRAMGASEAGKLGAVAVIIRSVTTSLDDVPHTGSMRYATGAPMIPAAAISTKAAELLSSTLQKNPSTSFFLEQSCETLPDAPSHNVIGELKGKEIPNEYIVVGGHLDSWDVGEGAHDDGAGCVQSIEALRLLRNLGYSPRYTLRAVMYMNEENGLKGGVTYADSARSKKEKHVMAIESDRGGFRPLAIGVVGTSAQKAQIKSWQPLFVPFGIHEVGISGSGADIGPLGPSGTMLMGLIPDSQRYFDYHHAPNDTFETVNKRELDLGAAAMAAMIYLVDKYGVAQ